MRRLAFTVSELLLVCVVLVILAFLFLPVFLSKKGRNTRTGCASNEKQLGLALLQYAQDNNNLLPVGLNGTGMGWGGAIFPYTKSAGLYLCPEDPAAKDEATSQTSGPVPISYGYNINLTHSPDTSKLTSPNRTVMLFEAQGARADVTQGDEGTSTGATGFTPAGDGTDGSLRAGPRAGVFYAAGWLGGRSVASPPGQFTDAHGRHQGASCFLFTDGHVKIARPEQISSGADAASPSSAQFGVFAAGTGVANKMGTFSAR